MIPEIRQADIWLTRLERGLTALVFSALIVAIGVNILARDLLHMASEQLLTAAPVLMLWVSLLGAVVALRKQRHIKIELLLRFLPSTYRRPAHILTCLFGMLVTAVLSYAAVVFVYEEIQLFGYWDGLSVLCFPLFFILVFLSLALQMFDRQPPHGSEDR